MARKRHAKPANPPPAALAPQTLDTQIEALATFLGTGSPLHEPIQSAGSPTEIPASSTQSLPQGAYNLRSKEDRVRSRILIDRLQNSGKDIDVGVLLRCLKDGQERLDKEIDTAVAEIYGHLDKSRKLVSEAEKSREFEEHNSQSRDSQVLQDLKERIGALMGHISNDEQNKLHARLQIITEQMKVTPFDTKILLSHPDGSPNENAFKQEAAVQKMLLGISDLETNIKLWVTTVNKSKEPTKEAKEPASKMSGKRNMADAERKQSAIKRYMHKFNIDEATAKQRWLRVHHTRLLEAEVMAQTCDEVQEDSKVAIANIEPLRIRSGQSYESTSMPPMDMQGQELTANANHSSPQARDATTDSISSPKPDLKSKFEAKTETEQPPIQGLGTTRGENMMAADVAPSYTAKTVMYADVTHPEEIVNLWIAFWSNDKSVWGPLHEYVMQFPVSTRDDVWESHMDWLAGGIYEPVALDGWVNTRCDEETTKRLDQIASRLKEELVIKPNSDRYLTPLDSYELTKKLEALQGPSGDIELMKKFEALQTPIQDLDGGGDANPAGYNQGGPIRGTLGQICRENNEKRALAEKQLQRLQDVKLEDREIQRQKVEGELKTQEGMLKWREERLQKRREQPPKPAEKLLEIELQRQEAEGIWRMREGISSMREALMKSREYDVKSGKESSKKRDQQPQKSNDQSPEYEIQQREIERLLKLREEHLHKREKKQLEVDELLQRLEKHLHKREKKQLEVDELLQRLEEQLQERESRLAERESRVHSREVEWEKHQEQRQEIERLLQHRDSQLQKRDDQVQTREEQLLFRERAADARITMGNQQATKVQTEVEEGKAKLAELYNAHEKVMRSIDAQDIELSHRTDALKNREAALSCREKCLEQLRMSLHEQLKVSMVVVAEPYTGWGGLTTAGWPGVLELAVQARMYVESRGSDWGQNEIQLADLKKIAAQVEEEAKKMIFGSGEIKAADVEKIAAALKVDENKDAGVITEVKENAAADKQWMGRDGNIPAGTSTKNAKPTSWDEFEPAKPTDSYEDENPPQASILVADCSGEWGCGCTSCHKREEIWKLHMPSSNKNGVDKPCKCEGVSRWSWCWDCGCYKNDFSAVYTNLHKDNSDW